MPDLSNELFLNNEGVRKPMISLMGYSASGFERLTTKIKKIDTSSTNSIEVANAPVKLYAKKDGFELTLEQNLATYLIKIKTAPLAYTLTSYSKPRLEKTILKSNSYILDDNIFQFTVCREEMRLSVKKVDAKEEIKHIHLTKDQEITFKNTPKIQEGGVYSQYREMEKTTKFLRKISQGDLGVSVFKIFDDHIIALGSTKEIARGGTGFGFGGFGAIPVATGGAFTVAFDPAVFAYGAYGSTKAVRIECLFDKDLNHVEGDIPLNVFDLIDNYADKLPEVPAETVFQLNNDYIWGYYNKPQNKYLLYRF